MPDVLCASLCINTTLPVHSRCTVCCVNNFQVILQVAFPMELDVYDFCSPELKVKLDGPRATLKDEQDRASAAAKLAKNKQKVSAMKFCCLQLSRVPQRGAQYVCSGRVEG